MELTELQAHWNEFGKTDPLWAILTVEGKRFGKWDVVEFFQKGEEDARIMMTYAQRYNLPRECKKALDFGCGVGRLTQALCKYFEECHGVDIAASMIEKAKEFNKHGGKCLYHVNMAADLAMFQEGQFSFVCSDMVLQHMEPRYSARYVAEFIRILAPGGLITFTLPTQRRGGGMTQLLPASGFRAQITPRPLPAALQAGTRQELRVLVKNISDVTWPALGGSDGRYQIKLAYLWQTEAGAPIVDKSNNDRQWAGRVGLRRDLPPGSEAELILYPQAPDTAGRYFLELDMLQEQVAWFKAKGSTPARVPVTVTEAVEQPEPTAASPPLGGQQGPQYAPPGPRRAPPEFVPRMEMHGVPKEVMVHLIETHGGKLVDAFEIPRPLGAWDRWMYLVTK
jgi:ubiquinone/menaquinone biosynthesis C-methylase UbiE